MTVLEMCACVRCGAMFGAMVATQLFCSELCASAARNFQLVPYEPQPIVERRDRPERRRVSSRRKPPVFVGTRFVVFEWQVEQLTRLLGPLVNQFDLSEWFFQLDEQMMHSPQVVPQRDGGVWLQEQTMAEAQRRGLIVSVARMPPARMSYQQHDYGDWQCPHEPRCGHPTRCRQLQDIAALKAQMRKV